MLTFAVVNRASSTAYYGMTFVAMVSARTYYPLKDDTFCGVGY